VCQFLCLCELIFCSGASARAAAEVVAIEADVDRLFASKAEMASAQEAVAVTGRLQV
jgi:hypothetical protein